ncbi:MAG TPA: hypothetical protein VGW78_00270 [Candidatus Babeliales bacterium]|jgi:adenylate kinase family enzyme|nr:hypothetical protein [Candidatus Babeliales bacterium]
MKIAIIGNCGSGKSTLGLMLHKILNIPLYHIDQYFWKPGWQRSDPIEFAKIHQSLCDQNAWILKAWQHAFWIIESSRQTLCHLFGYSNLSLLVSRI